MYLAPWLGHFCRRAVGNVRYLRNYTTLDNLYGICTRRTVIENEKNIPRKVGLVVYFPCCRGDQQK